MLYPSFSKLAALLALGATCALGQTYTLTNNCPTSIDVFLNADKLGTLATGGSLSRSDLGPRAGQFWTTANGGRDQYSSTTADFVLMPTWYWYRIVMSPNPNDFNVGISLTPNKPESDGFCHVATCNDPSCGTYTSTYFKGPGPAPDAPSVGFPFNQCRHNDTDYTITFCPTGQFPPEPPGVTVRAPINNQKCLDVKGAVFANGTPVQIYDCNGTNAQKWVFQINNQGPTQLRLANTNFCLDASTVTENGAKMKIWQCYDNLPAQQWVVTGTNYDLKLKLNSKNLCLDLTKGSTANSNVAQVWDCGGPRNPNQVWGWTPKLVGPL